MKFIFDSLDELDGFVQYLFKTREAAPRIVGASPALAAPYGVDEPPYGVDEPEVPDAHLTPEERAAALAAYPARSEWPNGDTPAQQDQAAATAPAAHVNAAGLPKRKRRTKAEMEADKAAAAAANAPAETNAPTDAQAVAATSPLAGANPFDASTSNAPAATAALNEAPAGTTGTLSALGGNDVRVDAQAPVDALDADVDPQAYIALRVAEMGGAFDARQHMKKCVEFIGALGKARYDEAFDLAGTSRSVATYTPADCAKHIAALEYLQLSGKGA